MGKIMNEQEVYSREVGFDMVIEYSGSNAVYIGEAFPGAATSEAKWRIQKLAYDGSGNMTTRRWANSRDTFDKVWTSRASYDYVDI